MLDLEPIKQRLDAAIADFISAPGPASKTYTASQARLDIAALLDEVLRLRQIEEAAKRWVDGKLCGDEQQTIRRLAT